MTTNDAAVPVATETERPAAPDCLLTLALPPELEDEIVDLLLDAPTLAGGFTLWAGAGMGTRTALAPGLERVLGRARRVFVQVAMAQQSVEPLLAKLAEALPDAPLAWWVVPILTFGRRGAA